VVVDMQITASFVIVTASMAGNLMIWACRRRLTGSLDSSGGGLP
jgi:hypothetical protein